MSFGVLALIVLAGLVGPLLSARWPAIPVVVGELAAGVVLGRSGTGWIDPAQPTVDFLAQIGFAMLMFTAGLHVPVRQPGIRGAARQGGLAALVAAALAVPAGILISTVTTGGHAAIYALVLASGSAAIVGPTLTEHRLGKDDRSLTVLAQVAVADVSAIAAVPLVLQPDNAPRAVLGGVLVAACALAALRAARALPSGWVGRIRRQSKRRAWALDLRLSLLTLFGLAWIAQRSGTSTLIAGFGAGLLVASIGGPKRLSRQVTGIAAGFFVPLFFVVLGARMDLRALGLHPALIELALLLVAFNVVVHLAAAAITRQPLAAGLVATAQLGVPAAVVVLGLEQDVLQPGTAAAILAASLVSLALCSFGVTRLAAIVSGRQPSCPPSYTTPPPAP